MLKGNAECVSWHEYCAQNTKLSHIFAHKGSKENVPCAAIETRRRNEGSDSFIPLGLASIN
jgi:hypothetical protein